MAYEHHCVPDRLVLETTFCPPQNCFRTRRLTIIHAFLHLKTSLLYLKEKKKKSNDPPNPFQKKTNTPIIIIIIIIKNPILETIRKH